MSPDFVSKFLLNTDDTGRFVVCSKRTGRKYFVEPVVGAHTPEWGSVDPGTGKLMVKKAWMKHPGAVRKEDSMVKLENGFNKVHDLEPGTSPLLYIEWIDNQYPDA